MMLMDWVVEGYVGFKPHKVTLDGQEFFTRDSALKAAAKCMLFEEGLDVEEDAGLVLIVDIYLERA